MNFTREELEDIWENKPYGYFSKLLKERKGTKKFTVTTQAKEWVVVDTETQEIWAKDHKSASSIAHYTNVNVLRRRLGRSTWDEKMTYSTTAVEVKQ